MFPQLKSSYYRSSQFSQSTCFPCFASPAKIFIPIQANMNNDIKQHAVALFGQDKAHQDLFLKLIQITQNTTTACLPTPLLDKAKKFGISSEDFRKVWSWSRHRHVLTRVFGHVKSSCFFTTSISHFLTDCGFTEEQKQKVSFFLRGSLAEQLASLRLEVPIPTPPRGDLAPTLPNSPSYFGASAQQGGEDQSPPILENLVAGLLNSARGVVSSPRLQREGIVDEEPMAPLTIPSAVPPQALSLLRFAAQSVGYPPNRFDERLAEGQVDGKAVAVEHKNSV